MYSYEHPAYGQLKAGRPARTYIQRLCEGIGYSPEDLTEAMNDRRSGERGSGISVLAARHDDDDDRLNTTNIVLPHRKLWHHVKVNFVIFNGLVICSE